MEKSRSGLLRKSFTVLGAEAVGAEKRRREWSFVWPVKLREVGSVKGSPNYWLMFERVIVFLLLLMHGWLWKGKVYNSICLVGWRG